MKKENQAFHYVCTYDEVEQILARQELYWVSDCGCREKKGDCAKSRIDLCLMF